MSNNSANRIQDNTYAGWIVSDGTLNPRHLIPRFLAVVKALAEEARATISAPWKAMALVSASGQ